MSPRYPLFNLSFLIIVMIPLSHAFFRQSLEDAFLFVPWESIDPFFDGCEHVHVESGGTIQEGRVAEAFDYTVDCAVGVDVAVGPGGDDLGYCVADYDFCELAGGVVQVATIPQSADAQWE